MRPRACRFEGEEAGIANGCGGCGETIDGGGSCDGHHRYHLRYPNGGILAIKSRVLACLKEIIINSRCHSAPKLLHHA